MIGLRGEAYTPEVIQADEGFDSGFPQAVGLLFPDPHDSKTRGLLRKPVREDNFSSHLQWARGSDHCSERTDPARMRVFFNRPSIARGAPHLHRDTQEHTPVPSGVCKAETFRPSEPF
jgi:hypothetical protein